MSKILVRYDLWKGLGQPQQIQIMDDLILNFQNII